MIKKIIQKYKNRVANRVDSEHDQAFLRLIIVTTAWLFCAYLYTRSPDYFWSVFVLTVSFFVSLCIFVHILAHPEKSPVRRVVGALHDNIATTFFLFITGTRAALYLFVYPFITVGNGFRFGVRYLVISGTMGLMGVASFIFYSEQWKGNTIVGIGILLSNLLVTVYTGILLSQLQQTKDKLETLATHDALTGLANRFLFMEKLTAAIAISQRQKWNFACLYFDLDGFKAVNDKYGHEVGDLLLKAVAEKVQGCIRKTDLLSRLGGDEFTIILEALNDPIAAERIAGNVIKAIESITNIDGHLVKVSCSLGIAFVNKEGRTENFSIDGLVKEADEAMYRAKKSGKGKFEFINFDCKSHLSVAPTADA